jgi:hypothetical protein
MARVLMCPQGAGLAHRADGEGKVAAELDRLIQ